MSIDDTRASPVVMSARLTASGVVGEGTSPPQRILGFLDSVLRGIGQVMLQNSSYSGLLFLIGLFYSSMIFGWAALLGTAVSTATAQLLGVDRSQVRDGLFGFNGTLVAIAVLYFLDPSLLSWAYALLAAACTTVVMAATARLLEPWKLPALTAPFILSALLFLLAGARFGRLQATGALPAASLPAAATVEGLVTLSTLAQGIFTGVAQVFFQGDAITGVIFAVGLLVSSRMACAAALLGSFGGMLVGWGMGAAEPAIRAGVFGFNSTLTAIALGSVGFALSVGSVAYGSLAIVTTAVVFAALSAALQPIGMSALTAPFVLVTWLFLLASPRFERLRTQAAS